LKPALNIQPSIWGLRKGEFQDVFSIMAKSSVVFFGGSALFADAIINKVPVFPWRNNLPGTEHIAQAYHQYATHKKPDRQILLQTQRKHLNRVIDAQYLDSTVPNNRACFYAVVSDLISRATQTELRTKDRSKDRSDTSQPHWVIPPAQASKNRGLPDRVSRSVWSNRKKLLQFNQSANEKIVSKPDIGVPQVFARVK